MAWPYALLIVLLGPVIGSFLGVLVDRWPERHSLSAPSTCQACSTRLGPLDLVPLLSGIRGACRYCGAAIPSHLFRIEMAATLASVAAVVIAPDTPVGLALAAYLWCLVGLFYADLLHFILPDPLNLALLLGGLALAVFDPSRTLIEAVISAVGGAAVFLAIRLIYRAIRGFEGLGLGDVKLMAGLGAGLGWMALPWVTLIAALLALLAALVERRGFSREIAVPFGAYLCGASLIILLFRALPLTSW